MILITDAHVSVAHDNVEPFFQMLEKIKDYDDIIVFLGDIFDLWVSLPGYQEECQRRFLEWCRERNQQKGVGFVEGNHEFFVVERNREAFSWSDGAGYESDGVLFVHGDLINPDDKKYFLLRRVTKNPLTRTIVRFLPFGARFAYYLKEKMKDANKEFKMGMPEAHIQNYAKQQFEAGHQHILVGHFHQPYRVDGPDGRFLQILPDWFATQFLSVYDGKDVRSLHWKEL